MKKTIKIIDLFNKIANNEEVPKKIKYTWEYEYKIDELRKTYCYFNAENERFDDDWFIIEILNDEVEIIEEDKKIEKKQQIDYLHVCTESNEYLVKKINEIIDRLNEMDKGE